jgi:hypothetical protein
MVLLARAVRPCCMIATKAMVPMDGPVRSNTGLLPHARWGGNPARAM